MTASSDLLSELHHMVSEENTSGRGVSRTCCPPAMSLSLTQAVLIRVVSLSRLTRIPRVNTLSSVTGAVSLAMVLLLRVSRSV